MELPRLYLGEAARWAALGYAREVLGGDVAEHPDLFRIAPQGAGIGISQIREAAAWARYAPVRAARRLVLIGPAERLSEEAASALLKSLEEAPGYLEFVLYGRAPDRLIPTVRSRCAILWAPLSRRLVEEELRRAGYRDKEVEFLVEFIDSAADLDALAGGTVSPREEWDEAVREAEGAGFRELAAKFVAYSGEPIRRRAMARALFERLSDQPADRVLEAAEVLAGGGREAVLALSRELVRYLAREGERLPPAVRRSWARKASLARGELEDNVNVKLLSEVILLWPRRG